MTTKTQCGVCGKPRSRFILNNKTVCLRCDELLFDMEIECDDEAYAITDGISKSPATTTKNTTQVTRVKARVTRR